MQTANFSQVKRLPPALLASMIFIAVFVNGCSRETKSEASPTVESLAIATVAPTVAAQVAAPTPTEAQEDYNTIVLASIKKQMKQSHLQLMGTVQDGNNALQMQIDFVAPDRLHIYTGPTEVIAIAGKFYVSVKDQWMVAPEVVKAQLTPMLDKLYEIPEVKNARMVSEEVVAKEQTTLYEYDYLSQRDGDEIEQHGRIWIRMADGLPVLNETIAKVDGKEQKTFFAFTYDKDTTVEAPTQLVEAPANVADASASNDIAGWQPFTSPDGRFATLMPSPPKQQVTKVNTAVGAVNLYTYAADGKMGGFTVAYADYPVDATKSVAVEDLLNGARDGMVANVNGTLLEEMPAAIDSFAGREVRVAVNQGAIIIQSRFYFVGSRFYQVMAIYPAQSPTGDVPTNFLDSFQLLN